MSLQSPPHETRAGHIAGNATKHAARHTKQYITGNRGATRYVQASIASWPMVLHGLLSHGTIFVRREREVIKMKYKSYTPEYKTKIVLEILREEQHISDIATREGINRTQLQNWRKEFLDNASIVFAKNKQDKQAEAEKKALEQREEALAKKVGILSIENDFLKKKYREIQGKEYEI